MRQEAAQEYTEALGQVFAGAFRLAEVAQDIGIPEALEMTAEEWMQERLAGPVRLDREQRRAVVAANPEKSTRELGRALGVSNRTIANDRAATLGGGQKVTPTPGQSRDSEPSTGQKFTEPQPPKPKPRPAPTEEEQQAARRAERTAVWITKVREALAVLVPMAGGPVPDEITTALSEQENTALAIALQGWRRSHARV